MFSYCIWYPSHPPVLVIILHTWTGIKTKVNQVYYNLFINTHSSWWDSVGKTSNVWGTGLDMWQRTILLFSLLPASSILFTTPCTLQVQDVYESAEFVKYKPYWQSLGISQFRMFPSLSCHCPSLVYSQGGGNQTYPMSISGRGSNKSMYPKSTSLESGGILGLLWLFRIFVVER